VLSVVVKTMQLLKASLGC